MKKFENMLVAFDLNKTLFFKTDTPLPRHHDRKIKRLYMYFRPYLKQLIQYLHSNQINYCFWSNMLGRNCIKYIKQLQSLGMNKYCGIFDQNFCDKAQNTNQSEQQVKSIKSLHKLSKIFEIDVQNCILIDDCKDKNVQGCNLIQVTPYEGQQNDQQILKVIENLKQFRKKILNESQGFLPMLQYTKYKFQEYQLAEVQQKKMQKKQKPYGSSHPTDPLIQNNPQLKKLKSDLVIQKQLRKNIISQIQILQKTNAQLGEDIKKQSQGKVVRKGDQLLVQVLMFAKNKKITEKKIEELQKKKKTCDEKITIIKKLMNNIIQKTKSEHPKPKYIQKSSETCSKSCSETQNLQIEIEKNEKEFKHKNISFQNEQTKTQVKQ